MIASNCKLQIRNCKFAICILQFAICNPPDRRDSFSTLVPKLRLGTQVCKLRLQAGEAEFPALGFPSRAWEPAARLTLVNLSMARPSFLRAAGMSGCAALGR